MRLTPLLHPWVKKLMADPAPLHAAVDQYDSPLNVHNLTPFLENISAYQAVLKELSVRHKLFFARKANKCMAFPIAAAQAGTGADTASYRELKQCLDAGMDAKDLILTAAVKNEKLLRLAVDHQVCMVLDNVDEWELLKNIIAEKKKKVAVMIRLGGFQFEGKTLPTRFGFPLTKACEFIQNIHHHEPYVDFAGLHFHLNGDSIEQRVAALEQSIQLVDRLRNSGISTPSLDMGGGLLMNYLSSEAEWETFNRELKRAILGKRSPITYQNDPLGIIKVADRLYGEPTVYPYFNDCHKSQMLKAILTAESTVYQKPIYQLLQERDIEFRMEPGRSLLDQCGITVAKVAFRKKDTDGNWVFGLEMNRTQMRSSSADFLLDPIHLPRMKDEVWSQEASSPVKGFLVGAYCLEQELILKRQLVFSHFPQVGDLLVFPNTGGYMMHFFESEAHLFELATNVIMVNDTDFVEDH